MLHFIKKRYIILILIQVFVINAKTQSIIEIIERSSNAGFTVTALSQEASPLDTARAFFISADGLAIINASILNEADTIIISENKNKNLKLSRIIAIHKWANIALIQVSSYRRRDGNFLIPHRFSFRIPEDILIIGQANSFEDGLTYGMTSKMIYSRKLGRGALINVDPGKTSSGSPIINQEGHLVGIYQYINSLSSGIMISAHTINDEQWTTINLPWYNFKFLQNKKQLTNPLIFEALMLQDMEMWSESSKLFTSAIQLNPREPELIALRSLSRYKYGNIFGANDDFSTATNLDPNCVTAYLARAHYYMQINDYKNAYNDLLTCTEKENFPLEVYFLLGQIQTWQNEIKKAHASYSFIIQSDSLYDNAWYERGRLLMAHASDKNRALSDFTVAARLNPHLSGVFTLIGSIRLEQRDYLEAISFFNQALRFNPDDMHALINRGMAYYNTGLKDQACEDWGKAGRLGNTEAFKLISRHCVHTR